ncbi:MAG: DNA recombination protein RmuC [Prevotella sp.]|nr:DNA recombination protein RmuC [Prevotella sp.]
MITYFVVAIVGMAAMAVLGFLVGKRNGDGGISKERQTILEERIGELTAETARQTDVIAQQTEDIKNLTSERDVQKVNVDNLLGQLSEMKAYHDRQMTDVKVNHEREIAELKASQEKQMENEKAVHDIQLQELRNLYARQFEEQKETSRIQLKEVKENSEKQLATLREMNQKQVEDQLALIKEQMRTTSEAVLKARQEELGMKNKEQVSSIVDPLQKSLKDMEEALNKSKEQQKEALTRLDETIRLNMEKSATLGETADRLTRALTGEVKVQGNFGELKLRQLLEDLELREGEQYDTQETLRDKAGKNAKGDDGKGLVPDFILHFPNNRHVVVDSKMSLTDYERYMNAADDNPQKSLFLKSHIDSVRAQVKRLARKEYTKYLPEGYNRLNFAIMYIPIEGALNLALLNDTSLWREAYDQGIMILGPQTMYMNLRVLEMMWTQVRQLKNQQVMIDAANMVIERVQDFGMRFMDVESSMNDAVKKITKLKITTSESGQSIITAAKKLLKAGARENRKKKTLDEMDESIFIDADPTVLLDVSPDNKPPEGNDSLSESER